MERDIFDYVFLLVYIFSVCHNTTVHHMSLPQLPSLLALLSVQAH